MKKVNGKRFVPTLTFGRVIGGAAVLLLVSAGTAYAANEWTGANIVDGSLTTDDIANNNLQGADIATATIVSSDLANDTVTNVDIADNTVRSTEIQDNSVGSGDIANGSLTTVDILDGTDHRRRRGRRQPGQRRHQQRSLTSADILNGTLTGADVEDAASTGRRRGDGSLGNADVADGSLGSADVADNSLTADDLAADSVGAPEIQSDAVNATEIANDSIDSGEIVDFGLSNADVGVLFAQVNADGTMANSSGGVTSSLISTGSYEVDFGRDISFCAYSATQGEASAGGAGGAIMAATDRAGNVEAVFVTARTNANALANRAFQLLVVC